MQQTQPEVPSQVLKPALQDLLIVIFIHGYATPLFNRCIQCQMMKASLRFRGTDSTFGEFPERLKHVLSQTITDLIVECVVFPAYEVYYAKSLKTSFTNGFRKDERRIGTSAPLWRKFTKACFSDRTLRLSGSPTGSQR